MKTRNDKINAAIEEWDEAIFKLLKSGASYQSTAEIAGCSISKVQYVAKKRGLTRRNAEESRAE